MLSSQELYERAFRSVRTRRSVEYRSGVMAALRFRCEGVTIQPPYRPGTAQADAWFAGVAEGHYCWRRAT